MAQEYNAYTLINHLYFPDKIEDPDAVIDGLTGRQRVLNNYVTGDYEKLKNAVHVSDIITNINGNHEYKILSSKDIDFENLYLPNSDISEAGWGSFPEDRRWPNNTSISINEMYELMNVIDYLLCATKDLFSEINQLKYTGGEENMLWFVSRATSSNPKRYLQEKLTPEQIANGNTSVGLYKTILNPNQYYTSLNAKAEDNTTYSFGVASRYFENEIVEEHRFTRIVKNLHSGKTLNGIEASFEPQSLVMESKSEAPYNTSGGEQIIIHGYLIGQDLKIYPGYNIFNFLYPDFNFALDPNNFVDVDNKSLFTKTYFKYNSTTFKKVYVDFLENMDSVTTGKAGENYILYIIDEVGGVEKKKIIYGSRSIYINGEGTGLARKPSIAEKYESYENFEYSAGYASEQFSEVDGVNVPFLYRIKDFNIIEISVSTPQTEVFNTITATIDVKYYKNSNNMKVKIIDLKDSDDITDIEGKKEIKLSKEYLQDNVLLYNPSRYNLPEKNNILISVDANVLRKSNVTTLKIDDEYLDYPYYWTEENINNDTNITTSYMSYFRYVGLDENKKRVFERFTSATDFKQYLRQNRFSTAEYFSQVYQKIEDPYTISYNITVSELLDQTYPYDKVKNMAKDIYDNHLRRENNNIVLSYTLPEDAEQIKLDLELLIEETGKTKEGFMKVPLNINKIHDISINFNNPKLLEEEGNKFRTIYYNVSKTTGNNLKNYTFEEWKDSPDNDINPGEYLTAYDLFINYSGEYNEIKTKMNIVSYLSQDFNYDNPDGIGIFPNELVESNLCYYDRRTYDNTLNSSNILNIKYDPDNKYVNLIGGKKLDYELMTKGANNSLIRRNANSYVIQNGSLYNLDNKYSQMFALHGLGLNYYCHGADSYAWANKSTSSNEYSFYNAVISHSLLTPCDISDSNNILKFLAISIDQKDYNDGVIIKDYVSYIQTQNTSSDLAYYENLEATEEENKYEYNGEFLNTYYNIITDDIKISKYSFSYNMLKEVSPLTNKKYTSYNIQTAYLEILNSTFYPSPNSYPPIHIDEENNQISAYYDLNNVDDYNRYVEYKNCWGSDTEGTDSNYYRPITLSMKILENHDSGIPFFNESNVAKLKFNIVRKDNVHNAPAFDGIRKTSLISSNLRYYVSDFIELNIPRSNQDDSDNITYTGSYLYLDDKTYKKDGLDFDNPNHIIKYKEWLFNANHEYKEGIIQLANNFDISSSETCPYPIPAIDINNTDNLWYDYDIARISDINKVKYRKSTEFINNNGIEDRSTPASGFYNNIQWDVDCEISYLTIKNIPTGISNNGFNCVLTSLKHYGSKNYNSIPPAQSTGARLSMNFISRLANSNDKSLRFSIAGDYEIFNYITDFENVYIDKGIIEGIQTWYTLEKQLQTDLVTYRQDNVFKNYVNKKDNIYRYYRTEVEAFLAFKIGNRADVGDNVIIDVEN